MILPKNIMLIKINFYRVSNDEAVNAEKKIVIMKCLKPMINFRRSSI
jgi:hypothetical protein